jgi:hypothetical protein
LDQPELLAGETINALGTGAGISIGSAVGIGVGVISAIAAAGAAVLILRRPHVSMTKSTDECSVEALDVDPQFSDAFSGEEWSKDAEQDVWEDESGEGTVFRRI